MCERESSSLPFFFGSKTANKTSRVLKVHKVIHTQTQALDRLCYKRTPIILEKLMNICVFIPAAAAAASPRCASQENNDCHSSHGYCEGDDDDGDASDDRERYS